MFVLVKLATSSIRVKDKKNTGQIKTSVSLYPTHQETCLVNLMILSVMFVFSLVGMLNDFNETKV